jgi:hypothetical protein
MTLALSASATMVRRRAHRPSRDPSPLPAAILRPLLHPGDADYEATGVSFPLMKKSDVNGDDTNGVYKYLKNEKAGLLGLTRIKVRLALRIPLLLVLIGFDAVELREVPHRQVRFCGLHTCRHGR